MCLSVCTLKKNTVVFWLNSQTQIEVESLFSILAVRAWGSATNLFQLQWKSFLKLKVKKTACFDYECGDGTCCGCPTWSLVAGWFFPLKRVGFLNIIHNWLISIDVSAVSNLDGNANIRLGDLGDWRVACQSGFHEGWRRLIFISGVWELESFQSEVLP